MEGGNFPESADLLLPIFSCHLPYRLDYGSFCSCILYISRLSLELRSVRPTCNASYMDTLVLAARCFWFHCSFLQASLPPPPLQFKATHPEILTLWGFAVTRYLVFALALCVCFFCIGLPSMVGSLVGKQERTRLIAFTHPVLVSLLRTHRGSLSIDFVSPNVWTLPVVLQGGR